MTKLVSYKVLRGHLGDKITEDGIVQHYFEPGETREANPTVVKHLVPLTLEDPEAEKADGDHEDKSEGDSIENKAAPKGGKAKGK